MIGKGFVKLVHGEDHLTSEFQETSAVRRCTGAFSAAFEQGEAKLLFGLGENARKRSL